jgi:hypothetical protein
VRAQWHCFKKIARDCGPGVARDLQRDFDHAGQEVCIDKAAGDVGQPGSSVFAAQSSRSPPLSTANGHSRTHMHSHTTQTSLKVQASCSSSNQSQGRCGDIYARVQPRCIEMSLFQ